MLKKALIISLLFISNITEAKDPLLLQISLGEWPPYLSENAEHQGPLAQLLKDIFSEEGYHVELRFLPWARAYADTARGKFDATAVWMHQPDRDADFIFSDPVLNEQFVFFHLKSQPFRMDYI